MREGLPENLQESIERNLGVEVTRSRPVSGGDINRASHITFGGGNECFCKWSASPAASEWLDYEVDGLRHLAEAGVPVPEVLGRVDSSSHAALLLEWLPAAPVSSGTGTALVKAVGFAYAKTSPTFGWPSTRYIGRLKLPPFSSQDPWEYYFHGLMAPLWDQVSSREWPSADRDRWKLVKGNSRIRFSGLGPPQLVHGDMWNGNWMSTSRGVFLIDPATHFGSAELDLAMAELFSGFPEDFYIGFRENLVNAEAYEQRRHFWQLYYLLVHAILFGGTYWERVRNIVHTLSRNAA